MKIVWFAPEIGNISSGVANHNLIFIDYLHNHPDVAQLIVVKYPFPEHGIMSPALEEINGVQYHLPRISVDYHNAFSSILQTDLKWIERLKIHFLKFVLKLKRIKQLDSETIKKWGKIEYGLLGIATVQTPFPNPIQEQIGRFITKLKPDIIQSLDAIFAIAGKFVKDIAKANICYQVVVEDEKNTLAPRTLSRIFWERQKMALEWVNSNQIVDQFITPSHYVKESLKLCGIKTEQIKMIPSPIVIKLLKFKSKKLARTKLNIPQDKQVILSVGRFIERKCFIDLLQVLKNLPEDVFLYIKRSVSVTDDLLPLGFNRFMNEVKNNNLEHRVYINSDVLPYDQMCEIYSAADIAVFPFLYEPFGMCAAEAMALKLPLIVYNSGNLPEFIQGNGFIVEPRDLEALHEKIKILLDNPSLREEMGSKGFELIKQYDINILGADLINLYREYFAR